MLVISFNKILSDFAINVIEDIRKAQRDTGRTASGRSAEMLRYTLIDGVQIIDGSGYLYYQEYGRAAGGMPPIQRIRQWIKEKGLKLNEWGVAKKIAKNGTLIWQKKAEPLGLSKIITDERINDLTKQLTLFATVEIKETFIKSLNSK